MTAYEIATIAHLWRNKSKDDVLDFMDFVIETSDPDVRGLVSIMAEEIRLQRLCGREYMGGSSVNIQTCLEDSEHLLARLLLDKSSHGSPSRIYLKAQLQNLAWETGRHEDPVKDWVDAEKVYMRLGLEYLAKLQLNQA